MFRIFRFTYLIIMKSDTDCYCLVKLLFYLRNIMLIQRLQPGKLINTLRMWKIFSSVLSTFTFWIQIPTCSSLSLRFSIDPIDLPMSSKLLATCQILKLILYIQVHTDTDKHTHKHTPAHT